MKTRAEQRLFADGAQINGAKKAKQRLLASLQSSVVAWSGSRSRESWFLESDKLCAEARRRTGLEDFGGPPIEPALSILVESLEREACLHPLGRLLMRFHLLGILEARLRLTKEWSKQSEGTPPISRPLFITGMPRSGSTFLHELLTLDPALRAPRVWEVMFPVSAQRPDNGWRDVRVGKAAACLWLFRRLVPQADAVYPMRARTPHECVAMHSYTFLSEEFVATCHIPTYEAFLRSSSLCPAYAWERRFLQHLQASQSPMQWLLKAPDHAFSSDALFSVFPDALIIQTHRNPLESLKSLIQLNDVLQGLYGKPLTHDQLAEREARNLAAAMDRLMRFRDKHPELANRFIDVNYAELTAEPLKVIRRVYQSFDMWLSEDTLERMRQLAVNRAAYKGRQSATPVAGAWAQPSLFSEYCHRFGISCGRVGVP